MTEGSGINEGHNNNSDKEVQVGEEGEVHGSYLLVNRKSLLCCSELGPLIGLRGGWWSNGRVFQVRNYEALCGCLFVSRSFHKQPSGGEILLCNHKSRDTLGRHSLYS